MNSTYSELCQFAIHHSETQSQFTGPSNRICPGDRVTFTCVVTSTNSTTWAVNFGRIDEDSCTYRHNTPNTQMCGPGNIFTSTRTDVNGDINNSSLSVVSVQSGLNGVSVTCADGNGVVIDSTDICVIG